MLSPQTHLQWPTVGASWLTPPHPRSPNLQYPGTFQFYLHILGLFNNQELEIWDSTQSRQGVTPTPTTADGGADRTTLRISFTTSDYLH